MILHEGVLQEQLSHVVLIDLVTIQELIALEVVVALEVVLHDRHRTDRLHHLETAIALSIFREEGFGSSFNGNSRFGGHR